MAKLRKMLGDVESQVCKDIMALIATQSQKTIERWAVEYAAERILPIYERACPGETLLAGIIEKCRAYISGDVKRGELKPALAEGRKLAAVTKGDIAQASARALSTACASIQTPTNSFGFLMYAAAAAAYSEIGLDRPRAEYDAIAEREMRYALDSLKRAAVENEPNPVRIDWRC